jgi:hypothetical protein
MRPSSRELLEGIAGALERQVAPAILDKWAASVLRSAVQLLGHLASRVEDEARILEEDNADARRVLTKMASRIAANRPRVAPLADAVAQALQAEETPSSDVVRLTERNDAYQAAIEFLVRNRDASVELPDGAIVREELHAYLQRRLAREHHLYFPSFTGAPF